MITTPAATAQAFGTTAQAFCPPVWWNFCLCGRSAEGGDRLGGAGDDEVLVAAEDAGVGRIGLVRAVALRDREGEHLAGTEVGDGRPLELVVDGDLFEGEGEVAAGQSSVDELQYAWAQGHVL